MSAILNVAIGLIFVFLLFSLVVSAKKEWSARSIKLSASPFCDLMHLTIIPSVERRSAEPTNKS